MAASTVAVSLTSTAYTALSSGESTLVIWPGQGSCRLHIGQSAPAASTDNWFPLPAGESFAIEGVASTDVVYARSEGATGQVKVLRK